MNSNEIDPLEQEVQESVGRRVRGLRKAIHLNLVQLAKEIGISQGHLSKIETGKATISIRTLSQICRFFNRPLDYLFHKEEATHIIGTLNVGEGPEKEAVIRFGREVQTRTGGQMSLVRLEADQIGTATNPVEYLRRGIIHMFMDDLLYFRSYVPDFDMLSLPYTFQDLDHHIRFLESPFFREQMQHSLLEQGIRLINPQWNWHRGVSRVLVSRAPVFSPDDVRGKRVRVYNSRAIKAYWEELGAKPVFVPFEDASRALDKEEIDIMPCYRAHAHTMGFCQYARFVTEIGDIPSVICVAMNADKYQMLTPDVQEALVASCDRAGERFSSLVTDTDLDGEARNIEQHSAVYIKTDVRLWQPASRAVRNALMDSGYLSREIWSQINALVR